MTLPYVERLFLPPVVNRDSLSLIWLRVWTGILLYFGICDEEERGHCAGLWSFNVSMSAPCPAWLIIIPLRVLYLVSALRVSSDSLAWF